MMHPDQIYELRQLRHHDLRVEAEQARALEGLSGNRTAAGIIRLATWLRRRGMRWVHSARLASRAG